VRPGMTGVFSRRQTWWGKVRQDGETETLKPVTTWLEGLEDEMHRSYETSDPYAPRPKFPWPLFSRTAGVVEREWRRR
jgi:hypothetical protein